MNGCGEEEVIMERGQGSGSGWSGVCIVFHGMMDIFNFSLLLVHACTNYDTSGEGKVIGAPGGETVDVLWRLFAAIAHVLRGRGAEVGRPAVLCGESLREPRQITFTIHKKRVRKRK